jgi:Mg-chelatase subunit ChlD
MTEIDLCIICDTTGSMASAIQCVQTTLKQVVSDLAAEGHDLMVAAVQYKDYGDHPEVGAVAFSTDVAATKRAIDSWQATGGNDHPEAMSLGLHAATELAWRSDSTKLVVLCADAPPHGIGSSGDSFPNGCKKGIDPIAMTVQLRKRGVALYTVGVNNPDDLTVAFLSTISKISGGRYLPLSDAAALSVVLVGGAKEEAQLNHFSEDMERERDVVETEAKNNGRVLSEEEVFAEVARRLQAKGVNVAQPTNSALLGGGHAWESAVEDMAQAQTLSTYGALQTKNKAAFVAKPRCADSASSRAFAYGRSPRDTEAEESESSMHAPAHAAELSYCAMPVAAEQVSRFFSRSKPTA